MPQSDQATAGIILHNSSSNSDFTGIQLVFFSLSLPNLYKGQQDQLVVALWTCVLVNLCEDTVENQCVLPVSLNDLVRPGRRGD